MSPLKVRSKRKRRSSTTDSHLLVKSHAEYEVSEWDGKKIVEALVTECKITKKEATQIQQEVHDEFRSMGKAEVDIKAVKSFVNYHLAKRGHNGPILSGQLTLGMSLYDLRELIKNKSSENSNVSNNNPEAISLTISEHTLKQFALKEVFSTEVSNAHLEGRVHLHDLGSINKVYSYHQDESILVKISGQIINVSFKRLWELSQAPTNNGADMETKELDGVFVLDKRGTWVNCQRVLRHKNTRPLVSVETESGENVIVTDNHPFIAHSGQFVKHECPICGALVGKTNGSTGRGNKTYKCTCGKQFVCRDTKYDSSNTMEVESGSLTTDDLAITDNSFPSKEVFSSNSFIFDDDFAYFIGLFISEGSFGPTWIEISGKNHRGRIASFCKRYKISHTMKETSVIVNSKPLQNTLRNWGIAGYSDEKSLPYFYLSLSNDILWSLLFGILDGDGSVRGCEMSLRVSSRSMVSQLTILCRKLRLRSRLSSISFSSMSSPKSFKSNKQMYRLAIYPSEADISNLQKSNRSCFTKMKASKKSGVRSAPDRNVSCSRIKKIKPIKYDQEYVYDITTDSGTFLCNGLLVHNCSAHSLRSIAFLGLGKYFMSDTKSTPASHAMTLVGHLNTFLCSMAHYYAGALGVDFVNIYFAPYVKDMDYEEMKQVAQYLIFSLSQSAFSRGGQVLFTDFNVHMTVPGWLKKVQAVGPKGQMLTKFITEDGKEVTHWDNSDISDGKVKVSKSRLKELGITEIPRTYSDFEETAQDFLKAMMDVWREGDANGMPFPFPKCFDKEVKLIAKKDGKIGIYSVEDVAGLHLSEHEVLLPRYDQTSEKHEWVPVKTTVDRGTEVGVMVSVSNNVNLKSTSDHKYYVMTDNGISVKTAGSLKVGDWLFYHHPLSSSSSQVNEVLDLFQLFRSEENLQVHNVESGGWKWIHDCSSTDLTAESYLTGARQKINSLPIKFEVTEDFAEIMGYFVSEGSYSGNRLNIASKEGSRTRSRIALLLKRLRWRFGSDKMSYYIYNRLLVSLFKSLCPSYHNSARQKAIPFVIFYSPEPVKKAFLRGLYDGDGSVKNTYIQYSTCSDQLAWGLKCLLSSFDIYSTIYSYRLEEYCGDYFNIAVKGTNSVDKISKILGPIGFNGIKNELVGILDSSWHNLYPTKFLSTENLEQNMLDSMVSVCRKTLKKQPKLKAGLIPVQIKEVYPVTVYAIAIEVDHPDHDFITADGILTKNCDLHLAKEDFTNERAGELLDYSCKIASENGAPYFVFDRDSTLLAACCRLRTKLDDSMFVEPERIRFCGFQNVTLNVPQCAYRANGDIEKFYSELDDVVDIAVKAHLQKKDYITELGSHPGAPLYDLIGREYFDGDSYINLDNATYIIGLIGINEAVKVLIGSDLHESKEAYDLGYDIICHLYGRVIDLSESHGLKFSLEESPAESAARRLALVDVEHFKEAKNVVNGNLKEGTIYYTNSIHYRPDADIDFIERLVGQSNFHDLIDSGAIIHMFCGENLPSPKSLKKVLLKTYDTTECAQLCVSPEFTSCRSCAKRCYGLQDNCPVCGSGDVDHVTRIVGYYSKVANFNVSKQEERKDRKVGNYVVPAG